MKKALGLITFLLICVSFVFNPAVVTADTITLRWEANTELDLAGYKLYYKLDTSGSPYNGVGSPIIMQTTNPGGENYIDPDVINNPTPEFTITLPDGWYFMVLTAYDIEDPINESGFSNEVTTRAVLTLPPSSNGSVTAVPVGTPPGVYRWNEVVTLTATPAEHFDFGAWSGDPINTPVTTNPTTVTMDNNKTIIATFTPSDTDYTLTININGNGSVAMDPPGGNYYAGTEVTITATPAPGWEFVEWTGNWAGTVNPATITMDASYTMTAVFANTPLKAPTGLGIISITP
jgi:hypothetical protein